MEKMKNRQIRIIGHKANTPRWVRRYISEGADGVEIDVILDGKGNLVSLHREFQRRRRLIREKIADSISSLRFSPTFPVHELADILPEGSFVILDLKDRIPPEIIKEVIYLMRNRKKIKPMISTRFHDNGMEIGSTVDIPIYFSIDHTPSFEEVENLRVKGFSINIAYLHRDIAVHLKRRGLEILAWVANDRESISNAVDCESDFIITDFPAETRKIVEEVFK